MDHCTILQKRQFLRTKKWLKPVSLFHSVCIWWLVKLITAQFYKKDIFSRRKLNPVSLLRSVCIWWLVKLITAQFYKKGQFLTKKNMTTKSSVCIRRLVKLIAAQFYKKDNFSRWRNTMTKLTRTCVKPVQNLYFFLVQTNLDAQKAPLVQSISRFQQVLLPFYIGTHTDPTLVRSTKDSTCPTGKPSH